MILLATIPHTGTMFMHKLFMDSGLSWATLGSGEDADVVFTHLYPAAIERINEFNGPIVCTMRAREKVEASHNACTINWGTTLAEFFAVFDKIKDRCLLVTIDNEATRDDDLLAVSNAVGVDLKTDWLPVNERT